jgi:hypothetical protein
VNRNFSERLLEGGRSYGGSFFTTVASCRMGVVSSDSAFGEENSALLGFLLGDHPVAGISLMSLSSVIG